MKLPEIQTKKKIRDALICSLLVQGKSKEEIADKVKLSVRTIDRVIYKNATVLKNALELTKDLEKVKRILFIQNQIRMSKKFSIDLEYSPMTLMDDLRDELEGNRIEQANVIVHNHFYKEIIEKPSLSRLEKYVATN
jgi:hypothetical protein